MAIKTHHLHTSSYDIICRHTNILIFDRLLTKLDDLDNFMPTNEMWFQCSVSVFVGMGNRVELVGNRWLAWFGLVCHEQLVGRTGSHQ